MKNSIEKTFEATTKKIWLALKSLPANLSKVFYRLFSSKKHPAAAADLRPSAQDASAAVTGTVEDKKPIHSSNVLKWWEKLAFGFNILYGVTKNILIVASLLLVLAGIFGAGAGLGFFANLISNEEPPSAEVMAEAVTDVELVASMHYNSGEKIADVRTDLVRSSVTADVISPLIKNGLIATEDEYFYEHEGVVPKAVLRALVTEVTGMGNTTGGSTITQQLVKQQLLSSEVTFSRKANEILLAMRLEKYFTKDEILTAYLNVSPFGRNNNGANIAGIEEAAQGIFGVSAAEVTLPQAAFLVGLPQNPYVYTPYTQYGELKEDKKDGIERMQTVLYRMFAEGYITETEYNDALTYDITQDFIAASPSNETRNNYLYQQIEKQTIELLMQQAVEADSLLFEDVDANVELYNEYYFAAEEKLRTSGYQVYSTIDKEIYSAMQEAAAANAGNIGETFYTTTVDEETGEEVETASPVQSGNVLYENATGRILGFIGGVDYELDQVDHAFDSYRSPASTIKPLLVYAPAIEMNLISPATMLPDYQIEYTNGDGSKWEITNVGKKLSNKPVSARYALYNSMNNPTVNLYLEMWQNNMKPYQYLFKMNYKQLSMDEFESYPSLALGATQSGVSVVEQTAAFATFANQGNYIDPYLIEKIVDPQGNVIYQHEAEKTRVFSEQTAYLTLDILRDVVDLAASKQITSQLNFDADFAAKTGTADQNQDYWFIASTPTVTLSSWIGYNEMYAFNDPNATGWPSVNNRTYWSAIANKIYEVDPEVFGTGLTHTRPDGIVEKSVLSATGTLPGKVTVPNTKTTLTVDGAKTTDLFKESNLPKAITYDFMVGGTAKQHQSYWNDYLKKAESAKKASGNSDDN